MDIEIIKSILRNIKVKDVMIENVNVLNPDMPISCLIEIYIQTIEDSFPVVNEKNELIGIVTRSDILRIFRLPRKHITRTSITEIFKYMGEKVEHIMTRNPVVANPEMKIEELLEIMTTYNKNQVPVIKDKKLVGMVSLRDILNVYHFLKSK